MKKSFQTKESEFTAADHSEMSGVLSLIPPNSYIYFDDKNSPNT